MSDAALAPQGLLRARRDLVAASSDGATVVKDPLSLEYFRLGEHEAFLLEQLRQPLSVPELTRRLQRRYPNEPATESQVLSFCATLNDCGLLLSDQPAPNADAASPPGGARWAAALLSPLAIRLPGFDPTPILDRLEWLGRLVFSRVFAALVLLGLLAAATGMLGRAEEVAQGLSRLVNLAAPSYAVMAAAAVMIVKTWHELGHAVACRRIGAECHEVGVMLLALMPCLYCDASDAWVAPSRWKRALVALAGVYFEAILAVGAAAAWLLLHDGPVRTMSLYVVVVASVSSLLINLNPLLRFDGYYVLSDLWGVANLHGQSRKALWRPLTRWVRGEPRSAAEPTDAPPALLASYGLASTLYGWAILALILFVSYETLDASGFRAAGDVLVGLSLAGVVTSSGRSTLGLIPRGPTLRKPTAVARLAIVAALALAAVTAVLRLPIEQTLLAPCRIESARFADVVARHSGLLRARVRHGDHVERGDLLAELYDPDAELRRVELEEREAALGVEIATLRTRSQLDPELLSEIARLEPTLAEVRRQLKTHDTQTARRRLRAPIGGRVSRPAERGKATDSETPEGELNTWAGAPLDPDNEGCLLQRGEPLCRVVGGGLQAILLLGEDDCGLVRVGDRVRIALDRSPGALIFGEVTSVAPDVAGQGVNEAERRLEAALDDPLASHTAAYRVSVSLLEEPGPEAQPGAIGRARIVTGDETVGGWLARWRQRLFRAG